MNTKSQWCVEGTAAPGILTISGVVQTGLSLKVDYDQGSGQHATVLELLYKVVGVDPEFQRVKVNKAAGNTIGPFLQNQVVTVKTDVGNSRDYSEMSPEQNKTVA